MSDVQTAQGPEVWINETQRKVQLCEESAELLKKQRQEVRDKIQMLQQDMQRLVDQVEMIENELQRLADQADDDDQSSEQLQVLRARAMQLQNMRLQLQQEFAEKKQQLQAKKAELQANQNNIQRVIAFCSDRMQKLDSHIKDSQIMIGRLQKTEGTAAEIFAKRFGHSAGQLQSGAADHIQRHNTIIQRCVALKYRLQQVISGLQEGTERQKVLVR